MRTRRPLGSPTSSSPRATSSRVCWLPVSIRSAWSSARGSIRIACRCAGSSSPARSTRGAAPRRSAPGLRSCGRERLAEASTQRIGLAADSGDARTNALLDDIAPALADLLGDLTDRQQVVARLVLVDGLRRSEAAARLERLAGDRLGGRRPGPRPLDREPRLGAGAAVRLRRGAGRGGDLTMPADPILTLAWLVLAHLFADFVVQDRPGRGGEERTRRKRLARAVRPRAGRGGVPPPVALAFGAPGLWTLLAITAFHVVIDRMKIVLTRGVQRRAVAAADRRHEGQAPAAGLGRAWTPLPAAYFAADQAAHIAVTVAAWAIWLSGQAPTAEWSTALGNLFAGRDLAIVHEVTLARGGRLVADRQLRAGALFVATLVRPIEFGAELATPVGDRGMRCRRGAGAHSPPGSWDIQIGPCAARVDEHARRGLPRPPRPPARPCRRRRRWARRSACWSGC